MQKRGWSNRRLHKRARFAPRLAATGAGGSPKATHVRLLLTLGLWKSQRAYHIKSTYEVLYGYNYMEQRTSQQAQHGRKTESAAKRHRSCHRHNAVVQLTRASYRCCCCRCLSHPYDQRPLRPRAGVADVQVVASGLCRRQRAKRPVDGAPKERTNKHNCVRARAREVHLV